jgi:lysophospholipase L1-like esterase
MILTFILSFFYCTYADYVRIMCLGDSITGSPGCWRALLWRQLQENGYTSVDFVGSLPPQGCGFSYDGDNEGHGGALAINVANDGNLTGWLKQTNPQLIIMHFGTNDVWSGRTTENIIKAFDTLLGQMRAQYANVYLLVAQIIPVAPTECSECPDRTIVLNKAIAEWATKNNTPQSPVVSVDLWTGWDAKTLTSDGVHPNDAGIIKLSDGWYPYVTKALDQIGGAKGEN